MRCSVNAAVGAHGAGLKDMGGCRLCAAAGNAYQGATGTFMGRDRDDSRFFRVSELLFRALPLDLPLRYSMRSCPSRPRTAGHLVAAATMGFTVYPPRPLSVGCGV